MQGYQKLDLADVSENKEPVRVDFSSEYSENFPKLLKALGVSLVVTSYHSHSVMLIRSKDGKLNCGVKKFIRPMGVTVSKDRLTISTAYRVLDFKASPQSYESVQQGSLDDLTAMSKKLQDKERDNDAFLTMRKEQIAAIKQSDVLYTERASLSTGMINTHDIAWGDEGLWVVNTSFSCLATLSPEYGFKARWKPPFISELTPDDKCHLNGMAMLNGAPRYVTTFNMTDKKDSWREELNGTLIDVKTNEFLLTGLCAPHSPKCHDGAVYLCDSGRGQIIRFDPLENTKHVICTLPGFTRGLIVFGDLIIVGTSRIRRSDAVQKYPLAEQIQPDETQCGIWVLNKQNGEIISNIIFSGDVEQLYDIAVLPESTYPELMSADDAVSAHLFEFSKELVNEKI